MKQLYGVPSHRIPVNIGRDRDIWLLKKREPSLTFGQIGDKFQMTGGAVQLAYKRQTRRELARLKNLQETAAAFCEFFDVLDNDDGRSSRNMFFQPHSDQARYLLDIDDNNYPNLSAQKRLLRRACKLLA